MQTSLARERHSQKGKAEGAHGTHEKEGANMLGQQTCVKRDLPGVQA